jgi:hypothetical protein
MRRPEAVFFRVDCSAFERPMLIKGRATADSKWAPRTEYEAMHAAGQRLNKSSTRTKVAPVSDLLLRDDLLLVELIDGVSVGAVLRNPWARRDEVLRAAGAAGEWLREFHDPRGGAPPNVDALLAELQQAMHRADRRPRRALAAAVGLITETSRTIGCCRVPQGWVHGDFKPDNLMKTAAATYGIDISGSQRSAVTYDLSHFLFHIDGALHHPRSWPLLRLRSAMRSAFLSGYGWAGELRAVLAWFELQRTLRFWALVDSTQSPNAARTRYLEHWYRMDTKRKTAELQEAVEGSR